MRYDGGLFAGGGFGSRGEPSAREQAFFDGHDGDGHDRDGGLERARWELLQFSRRNGAALDAARGALLRAHIQQEAQRITGEMERLQALAEYAVRADIPQDETDYLSMSPAEFHACERRLRARARGLNS